MKRTRDRRPLTGTGTDVSVDKKLTRSPAHVMSRAFCFSALFSSAREAESRLVEGQNDDPNPLSSEDSEATRLTLMEEVLLLGIKDDCEEHRSLFNSSHTCMSLVLRGCVMIELGLRNRIVLEPGEMELLSRKVSVKDPRPTGEVFLDEALKHIKEKSCTIREWMLLLEGCTYNPFNLRFQLHNVRERVANSLVEKSVLTVEKWNFLVFHTTKHTLVDVEVKQRVIKKIQDALLLWVDVTQRFDERVLALVLLAMASDVLRNALESLSEEYYKVAVERMRKLLRTHHDPDVEAQKPGANEVLWATVASCEFDSKSVRWLQSARSN
ncbi:Golgi phosphoprotein 3-like isoform X2 [Oscarella lobularis]